MRKFLVGGKRFSDIPAGTLPFGINPKPFREKVLGFELLTTS